ncbi:a-factor receptor [Paramarasmius palmivorus]|uniref:A-factor receptor n=1 Tax=Paramarasmius palmivorus TaxID=297713 RepID=A0AAW0BIT2_9AGAR
MALATTEMLFNIPLCSYGLYLNVTRGKIHPWKSWEDTHFDYWIVDKFPAILWRRNHDAVVMMELNRWSLVVAAFVFFGFFGFADEARKNYKKAAYTVAKTLGIPLPKSNKTSNPSSSMLKDMKGAPRPLVLSSGPGSLPLYLQSKSTQSTTFSSTRNSRSSVSGTSLHKSDFSSTAAPSTPPLPAYKLSESLPTTPITADSSEASYDIDLEVYQRPMSTITVSSATYAPSSTIPNSSPPPIRGAITSAGIPIEERIADPAELSRAVGPNSPLHPSSHWPRAV